MKILPKYIKLLLGVKAMQKYLNKQNRICKI